MLNRIKRALRIMKIELLGRICKLKSFPVDEPVDFVVLWVDSEDEVWKQEKRKYENDHIDEKDDERYRNWDQFKYWFRMVEKYAPWVRKIHLVTCGHYPNWLNISHKKLNLVNHKDFIPEKYLPTFSNNTIELNLHRIEGLSECFVYFNDDMYLNKPSKKEDFFDRYYPKYYCAAVPRRSYWFNSLHEYMLLNNIVLINEYFDVKSCIDNNLTLWFNKNYKVEKKYNLLSYRDNYLYGMEFPHVGNPMRKSTMEKTWDVANKELDRTCQNKFRTPFNLQQQIFHLWDIMNGEFFPVDKNHYGRVIGCIPENISVIDKIISEEEELMICVNDTDLIGDKFEYVKTEMDKILEKNYPNKSSFEL